MITAPILILLYKTTAHLHADLYGCISKKFEKGIGTQNKSILIVCLIILFHHDLSCTKYN